MKLFSRLLLYVSLSTGLCHSTVSAADRPIAFPGAEGFGRHAIGGRLGADGNGSAEIYHVTNLNDSGEGSFREGVSRSGRIIVFDVSGTIHLESPLQVKGHNTILGQTAPGDGVQIYGNQVSFSGADELIIRHLRLRMGIDGAPGKDACGAAYGENMIFDHVSVLWGKDECFSISANNLDRGPRNITIQNSIIGQGLQTHSCGGLIQTNGGVTLYRNLYIDNKTRNPKVKGITQFVNNVVYNWGNGAAYNMSGNSERTSYAEISGNYFVKGPWIGATPPFVGGNDNFHFYADGNYYDANLNGKPDGVEITAEDYEKCGGDRLADKTALNRGMAGQTTGSFSSFPEIDGLMSAPEALEWVRLNAGASLPAHDEVDRYLLAQLSSYGTSGPERGISNEKLLPHKGTGYLRPGVRKTDSDNDGIPDEWEIANGLDPYDGTDAVRLSPDGYTYIEEYVFTIR